MSGARGLVRAAIVRSLVPFLRRYPTFDVAAALAAVGLEPSQVEDPEGWIDLAQCVALLEHAARATGDAALGLRFGHQLPWKDIGVLSHVVFHSPTVGAALGNACRYFAMQQTAGHPVLEVEGDLARVRHVISDPTIAAHPQNSELTLTMFTRICREGTASPGWAPREVHFRHRAADDGRAQRSYFAAPVHFGQPRDALILTAAELRAPMHTADDVLLPILLRHADECLARLPAADDFPGEVRRAIAAALGTGDVTVEDIARVLGMSPRSVQRKLQEVEQSFKDIVAETRLALSRRYLEDPALSLTETAFLLGYSDLSAFSRAFRRWTGQSALEFRRARAAR